MTQVRPYSESSVYLSPGPVPIEVHAGTTLALVPAPNAAAPVAALEAGVDEGAIAVPPCPIVAGTLATGYVISGLLCVWIRVPIDPYNLKLLI